MPDVFDSRLDRGQIYRALEDALRRTSDTIDALRDSGAELDLLFRVARRAEAVAGAGEGGSWYPAVEAVAGIPVGQVAVERMQRTARRELRIIDMPPYHGTAERYAAQEVLQAARMAEGIVYRVIYSRAACEDPVAAPNLIRTVVRRVSARQVRLGATTRFQAGLQAGRRGWL